MRRLKFKKWVTCVLLAIMVISLTLLTSVRFNDMKTDIMFSSICLLSVIVNGILVELFN